MGRTTKCLRKLERMNKTLRHQESDRMPISDMLLDVVELRRQFGHRIAFWAGPGGST